MCRLLAVVGTTKPKLAMEFVENCEPSMSKGNDDGIGMMQCFNDGNIVYDKWVKNKDFLNVKMNSDLIEIMSPLEGVIDMNFASNDYETGTLFDLNNEALPTTICLHTRKATNGICINNTHPLVHNGIHLMHNGIISNHNDFKKTVSTNDTEAILERYQYHDIQHNPNNIHNLIGDLKGWEACLVMSKIDDKIILDVWKDDKAPLVCAYVDELNAFVFASSNIIISSSCAKMKMECSEILNIKNNSFIRFNAITGEIILKEHITPIQVISPTKKEQMKIVYPTYPSYNDLDYKDTFFDDNDDRDIVDEEAMFEYLKMKLTDHEKKLLDSFDAVTQRDIILYSDMSVTEAFRILRGDEYETRTY